jgi:hypothetical protein
MCISKKRPPQICGPREYRNEGPRVGPAHAYDAAPTARQRISHPRSPNSRAPSRSVFQTARPVIRGNGGAPCQQTITRVICVREPRLPRVQTSSRREEYVCLFSLSPKKRDIQGVGGLTNATRYTHAIATAS